MKIIKLSFLTCFFLILTQFLIAQSEATVVYIEQYRKIAAQEMKRTGIPASITLAQGILESNSGESPLAKKYNNHFGIKCKNDWKGETTYQDDDAKNECFRVYTNAAASFIDHSNFLKNRPNYANLFLLDPLDDSAWAFGLKKAGYATAPDYAKKILKVIDDYELSQYNFPELDDEETDSPIIVNKNTPTSFKDSLQNTIAKKDSIVKLDTIIKANAIDTLKVTQILPDSSQKTIEKSLPKRIVAEDTTSVSLSTIKGITPTDSNPAKNAMPTMNRMQLDQMDQRDTIVQVKMTDVKKDTAPVVKINKLSMSIPKGKFRINGTEVVWAEAGNSYLGIAADYKIPLFKLFEYNELKETELIEKDQLVYLTPKKKEGASSIHHAKAGESLYEISQLEAVQLSFLQLYNPTLSLEPLQEGTIVFLFKQKEIPALKKPQTSTKPKTTFLQKLINKN